MIAALLRAQERPEFVDAVRALDRVLLSGAYVIPLYHSPEQWIARWTTNAAIRTRTALSGFLPETWWRQDRWSVISNQEFGDHGYRFA